MAAVNDKKVVEFNRIVADKLNLNPLDADPSDLQEGDLWYRGDTHALRLRLASSTVTVTVS